MHVRQTTRWTLLVVDALRAASGSPGHRRGILPTQLNWTRTSAEALSAELRRVQDQHVVYLGSPLAIHEWPDDLRQSMAEFAACGRTEFNIEGNLFKGLLRS